MQQKLGVKQLHVLELTKAGFKPFFFTKLKLDQETDLTKGFDHIWPTFWDPEMGIHQLGLEGSPKDSKGLWDPRDQFHVSGPFRSFRTLLLPYLGGPWRSYSPIPLIWLSFGAIRCAWRKLAARPRPGKAAKSFQKKLGSTTGFTTPLLLGAFIWFT